MITHALTLTSTSHAISSITPSTSGSNAHRPQPVLGSSAFQTLLTIAPADLPSKSAAAMHLTLGDVDMVDDNQQDVPDVHHVNEPDYIVAFNGKFQNGQLQAASHELEETNVLYPETYLEPKVVDQWNPRQQENTMEN